MKKLIIVIIMVVFFISGCSKDNQETSWNMRSVQDKSGKVIYCSSETQDLHLNAKSKNVTCILKEPSITIINQDSGEEWTGKCKIIDKDSIATIYEVVFDNNKTGHIAKSITKYADNTQENTLIISCEGYYLNLTENIDEVN